MWIRKDDVFEPVVSPDVFYIVRGIILEQSRRPTDEQMISGLRGLMGRHPVLSAALIDAAEDLPPSSVYRARFGSLLNAYRLAGYVPDRDFDYVEANRHLRALRPGLLQGLADRLGRVGASVRVDGPSGLLLINEEYSASLVLSRCRQTPAGSLRWEVRFNGRIAPDIAVLARMDEANERPADYYLLPVADLPSPRLLLCEEHGAYLDTYQFDSLEYFAALAARQKVEVPA